MSGDDRVLDGASAPDQGSPPRERGRPAVTRQGAGSEVKAQSDALGVLIRSGVDPEDAARRVGLDGLAFTGAIPVSLRPTNDAATKLEE